MNCLHGNMLTVGTVGEMKYERTKHMLRKYKITYRAVKNQRTVEMMAFSKYDAKQRFYRTYPKYQVVKIEEADNE